MASSKIRQAVVAGQFYPALAPEIKKLIGSFIEGRDIKSNALACLLPHAGYIYSGKVAVQTLARINIKEKIILFGPNHTGRGANFSIMTAGVWVTPLGQINIDSRLAGDILKASEYLKDDFSAHDQEHSLEVELPILQYFRKEFEIVPVAFMSEDLLALRKIGETVAGVIKRAGLQDKVLLVASSDMTHYEPQKDAQAKDQLALKAILELDPDRLERAVRLYNITMCGFAPVIVMLSAAKLLGAKRAKLVRYQTSGDVTGEKDSVVGYAGIIVA